MTPTVEEIHDRLLNDIRLRTGLSYRHVQGIDTAEERLATTVLPILVEWVSVVDHPNMRAAIYSRFNSKYAAPFLKSMVDWARKETDPTAIDILNFALGTAACSSEAEWLWNVALELPQSSNYYCFIAKLAKLPQTTARARAWLVDAVSAGGLGFAELRLISEVEDPRLLAWFSGKINDPDKRIAALAGRVVGRGKKLPNGFVYSPHEPIYSDNLYSWEGDADQLEATLKELARRFALKIPRSILKGAFLPRLALDRWVFIDIDTKDSKPMRLWLRLEDVDAIEIALTNCRVAPVQ